MVFQLVLWFIMGLLGLFIFLKVIRFISMLMDILPLSKVFKVLLLFIWLGFITTFKLMFNNMLAGV